MKVLSKNLPSQMRDSKGRLIKIRSYDNSDYKDLKKLYDDFEPKGLEAGLPPIDKRIRHEWLDKMVTSLFNVVALYRGRVIGHATLELSEVNAYPEFLIFIKQGFRYCGIGTRLSEIMKDVAQETGCKKVWLTVRTGNAIAVKVFKKVGFNFVGGIDIQREMEFVVGQARK